MRRKTLLHVLAALALCACACCACAPQGTLSLPPRFTQEGEKIAVFSEGASALFEKRRGGNGGVFDCTFSEGNVVFGGDAMQLFLTQEGGYAGAEYRSRQTYSYGFYSVSMKAARCGGVISSFFTYTGSPWDEIDVEFLGKDTSKVQFNYYTRGKGGHEFLYELGFDGAEDFHEYAFLWLKDSITFYVDGVAVHRAEEDIPTTPAKIMMNIWKTKGLADWSGDFEGSKLPVCASYRWIGFSPAEG